MLALRAVDVGFDATVKVTLAGPIPAWLLPLPTFNHVLSLVLAVQTQPLSVVTVSVPVPPEEAKSRPVADSV